MKKGGVLRFDSFFSQFVCLLRAPVSTVRAQQAFPLMTYGIYVKPVCNTFYAHNRYMIHRLNLMKHPEGLRKWPKP